jgi:formate hydrogenlyase subunit 3/multisubunit Na+/H+ antiporter MnhD subunit
MVWVLIPALLSVVMLVLNRWGRFVTILGTFTTLVLAAMAWLLPVKEQFFLGPWTINFTDTWVILGRRFVLGPADRSALVILYLAAAFWFGAAYVARTSSLFVPIGLAMVALLTAALGVEPFLYAALLIEMAVLVSVPLLSPPDSQVGRGVLRYITFLTLGVPFILFAGWMMSGVELDLVDEAFLRRTSYFVGLGFALQLAVFPFHSWIPMLGKETHPYAAAFVFTMVPGAITLIVLSYFEGFPWFGATPEAYVLMRVIGVMMVVFAGLWAAFQDNLGSMLGYAAILEIGFSLVLIGILAGDFRSEYLGLFYAMLFPRGLGLGLWALALATLRRRTSSLNIDEIQGFGRVLPLTTGALILAQFSLAGIPLLASFPIRLPLWNELARVSPMITFWALIGCMGLLFGGVRTLVVLVTGDDETSWKITETRQERVFFGIGVMLLILMGVIPQLFLPFLANLPFKFVQFTP